MQKVYKAAPLLFPSRTDRDPIRILYVVLFDDGVHVMPQSIPCKTEGAANRERRRYAGARVVAKVLR